MIMEVFLRVVQNYGRNTFGEILLTHVDEIFSTITVTQCITDECYDYHGEYW